MIVRRCSQGHRVRLHRNTTPDATRVKTYPDGAVETLTYPSAQYDYFVEVDGTVVKRSDSFETVEEYFVSECAKKHGDGHGRLLIGKHHVINGVATTQADYPTDSNTKSEIKVFFDNRSIAYSDSDTKSVLLDNIIMDDSSMKHIRR